MIDLIHGDCLDSIRLIPDGSVDMVLTDPPYGATQCKWDSVVPFEPMWEQLKRITKKNGAIVLTANQPFASALVMSNPSMFAYQWIWIKTKITGVLNAKKMPVRKHEHVLVFCDRKSTAVYNAQGLAPKGTLTKQGGNSNNYGNRPVDPYIQEWTNWPRDVLEIPSEGKTIHPTQKPVALMEYLVKTYTNEGESVLDFTMGSGTTGVACVKTNRKFIGIELNENYFHIAQKRINDSIKSCSDCVER
jgi:site-specific DNA-methyltransferase (adenine-specific)